MNIVESVVHTVMVHRLKDALSLLSDSEQALALLKEKNPTGIKGFHTFFHTGILLFFFLLYSYCFYFPRERRHAFRSSCSFSSLFAVGVSHAP